MITSTVTNTTDVVMRCLSDDRSIAISVLRSINNFSLHLNLYFHD